MLKPCSGSFLEDLLKGMPLTPFLETESALDIFLSRAVAMSTISDPKQAVSRLSAGKRHNIHEWV